MNSRTELYGTCSGKSACFQILPNLLHKKPERREEVNLKLNAFAFARVIAYRNDQSVWLRSYNIKYVHNLTNDL